ncbi:MAG: hypothetical protein CME62_17800 [Halobacteriovoraceae bacterium]|nr:hypothetical protein [Halobacteriovoraceae bacterium]|tara:strand:- start:6665 stop:7348 length:684 start_codon:yes stop_codon:yes gene_type:complete
MILDFQNVSYCIPNGQSIYENLNLKVHHNEYYGVLGKNGAGKTTLIEMIMGMRKLKTGNIYAFGEDVNHTGRKNKHKIFVVTHDMQVPGNIILKDLFKFYAYFYPQYDKEIEAQLVELFELDASKKFGTLSTGQKIKAFLCAAFAARAQLYLFDEVTAVLDPKSRYNFFKFLNQYRDINDCSVFLATNIAEDLENCMDKVLFIDDDHNVLVKDTHDINKLFGEKESA